MSTLVIAASKDNWIYSAFSGKNYGASNALYLARTVASARTILEFLLSTLPAGATINSAILSLYTWAEGYGGGQSVDVYKLSRTNWLEGIGNPSITGSSNWTTYDVDLDWTTPGGDYVIVDPAFATAIMPAEGNWITWDITAIVKDAQLLSIPVELLIIYQADGTADAYLYGRTYVTNPALVPKLTIDYTGATPYQSPPCVIDFKGILDCIGWKWRAGGI